MKYLEYYKTCMETGKLINYNGLCNEPGIEEVDLDLFKPTNEDYEKYKINAYWASGYSNKDWNNHSLQNEITRGFTPLRQTVILFMAAVNGEL